jgi:uncharacterized membrane protein YgcG
MILRRLILLLVLLVSTPLMAAEIIYSFNSDIDVRANGDIYVTENIVVGAEGRAIKRGIYRDFPTTYTNTQGHRMRVSFEVLGVKRDGQPEKFHIEDRANGKRVYIGHSNIFLTPGQYDYQIVYLTTRQIGFFDDYDELYWNVTGNGWEFPILEASARVKLPEPVTSIQLNGFTGPQGSTEQNLRSGRMSGDQVYFQTTKPLSQYQGLTIVVAWPTGIVSKPDDAQRQAWFIQDNLNSIIAFSGAIILLLYYWLIWTRVGRDPSAGVIVPQYQPPAGYSPASMRFVTNMGYDKKCFTTAIINLAVKGAVQINDDNDDNFSLELLDKADVPLAAGEAVVLRQLFKNGRKLEITQSEHSLLGKAIDKHESSLKRDYEKIYFVTNRWYLVPGVLLSLLTLGLILKTVSSEGMLISTVVFGLFSFIPILMLIVSIRRLIRGGFMDKINFAANIAIIIFMAVFFINSDLPLEDMSVGVPWPAIAGVSVMLLMNYFFYHLLKAPTHAGRKLLDQVEGFKHYLEVAEEDEISLTDQPNFTTDIYEEYLPYAIALDLENAWTEKLNRTIETGAIDKSYSRPIWYHGHGHPGRHFSENLSKSFNSAISSSSVAPGSSSGSSGGSSGGGGGGGGGGGW